MSLIKLTEKSNFDTLYSKPVCHVVSKAFSISKNTAAVDMLLKLRVTWSVSLIHCRMTKTSITCRKSPPIPLQNHLRSLYVTSLPYHPSYSCYTRLLNIHTKSKRLLEIKSESSPKQLTHTEPSSKPLPKKTRHSILINLNMNAITG
jgi:hypothetical protein